MSMHLRNIKNPKFKLIEGGYIPTSCFVVKNSNFPDFLRSKKKVKIFKLSGNSFSIESPFKGGWWIYYPSSFWRYTPLVLGNYCVHINKKYKLIKAGCYVINLATFDKALKEVSELIKNKRLRNARFLKATSALLYFPGGILHFPSIMHDRSCSYYIYSDVVKFRKDLKKLYSI